MLVLLLLAGPLRADPQHEPFGPVRLGMSESQFAKQLGPPQKRSKPVLEAATGLTVSNWSYPLHGLILTMAHEKPNAPWVIDRLRAVAPCKFKTSRGVGLGDTLARVRVAYTLGGEDGPTEQIILGDAYGGLIFNLKKGKVVEIFLGAAAE